MSLRRIFFCTLLCLLCHETAARSGQNGFWQCTTKDQDHKEWRYSSPYQKVAQNLAFDACKKESQAPASCKTSRDHCEHFINGLRITTAAAHWRCTALDLEANAWKSNAHRSRIDAALAASAYCKSNSPVPETCYTNLVTCLKSGGEVAL
jgi:hypothetical protein